MPEHNQGALPFACRDFEQLRSRRQIYVDKTGLLCSFARERSICFLFRPRGFGKSLLLSALGSLFKNGLQYFKGLAIEKLWQDQTYSVLSLDFSAMNCSSVETFSEELHNALTSFASDHNINIKQELGDNVAPAVLLAAIVHKSRDRVVLLVDDYDAPLLQHLEDRYAFNEFSELINSLMHTLQNNLDKLRFAFFTGIVRFNTSNFLNTLSNWKDLSLEPEYAALAGFTPREVEQYLGTYLQAAAQVQGESTEVLRLELEATYGGFCFDRGAPRRLYTPRSLLSFLAKPRQGLKFYWDDKPFRKQAALYFANRSRNADGSYSFAKFAEDSGVFYDDLQRPVEPGRCATASLLFQAGYLSLRQNYEVSFTAAPPNFELKRLLALLFLKEIEHSSILNELGLKFPGKLVQALDKCSLQLIAPCFNEIFHTSWCQKHAAVFADVVSVRDVLLRTLLAFGFVAEGRVVSSDKLCSLALLRRGQRFVFLFKLCTQSGTEAVLLQQAVAELKTRDYGRDMPDAPTHSMAMVIDPVRKAITVAQDFM